MTAESSTCDVALCRRRSADSMAARSAATPASISARCSGDYLGSRAIASRSSVRARSALSSVSSAASYSPMLAVSGGVTRCGSAFRLRGVCSTLDATAGFEGALVGADDFVRQREVVGFLPICNPFNKSGRPTSRRGMLLPRRLAGLCGDQPRARCYQLCYLIAATRREAPSELRSA